MFRKTREPGHGAGPRERERRIRFEIQDDDRPETKKERGVDPYNTAKPGR